MYTAIQWMLVVHVAAAILLVAASYAALAAPLPEHRRPLLMRSGIFALLIFVTGFGLHGMQRMPWEGWVFVKIACWVVLAMMVPLVFRQPGNVATLRVVTAATVVVAVIMAIIRPF